MKKTFLAFLLISSFLGLYADGPYHLQGKFTAYWDNGVGTITVSPDAGGPDVVFYCIPNGNHVEDYNYRSYWDNFNDAFYYGDNHVDMEYHVLTGGNLIVNTPVFS